jgi:hypothetical protein
MAHDILQYLQQHTERYMLELASWASIESFTADREGLLAFAGLFGERMRELDLEVEAVGPAIRSTPAAPWRPSRSKCATASSTGRGSTT